MKLIERRTTWLVAPWYLCRAYYDAPRNEVVFAVFPLHYVLIFAWFLNVKWFHYRHSPTWIDRAIKESNTSRQESPAVSNHIPDVGKMVSQRAPFVPSTGCRRETVECNGADEMQLPGDAK